MAGAELENAAAASGAAAGANKTRSSVSGLEMGGSNSVQELVANRGRRRRSLRAIAGAVAVGVVVIVLVVVGAVMLSQSPPAAGQLRDSAPAGAAAPQRSVDAADVLDSKYATPDFNGSWVSGDPSVRLQDVVEGRFSAEDHFNGSWVSESEFLYRDEAGRPLLFNVINRTARAVLRHHASIPPSTIKLELSADQRFLMAVYNYSKLFRHTYMAQYDIIDVETGRRLPLESREAHTEDGRVLQLAVWAPAGNGIAFVYRNNLFYKPSPSAPDVKLTTDGVFSTVYHGVPDWVYEEEVFASNTALWFSPDGSKLAYATFNDSRTRIMSIPYYGAPTVLEFQYPRAINLRYPKPGTPNPSVLLTVVELDKGEDTRGVRLAPPESLSDPILSTVSWANNDEVAAIWLNRVQNKGELVICTAMASQCNTSHSLVEESGWLDLFVPPLFSKDGSQLIFVYPHDQGGNAGAFRHVTLIQRDSRLMVTPLTQGKFVVTDILSWDEAAHLIYFLATDNNDPSVLHLYSVSDDPTSAPNEHTCISCNFKNHVSSKPCLYNKASFSKDSSYYMFSCNGPDVPVLSLYNKENEFQFMWEDNKDVRELIKHHSLPTVKQLSVDVPGGFKAQVQLLLPPNLDTSGNKKYPLLVNVYGGPDSYQVTKRFSIDWSTYLTVNRSIIYASIDGRGSGLKGNKMLFAGYRRLGSVEIEDQINVTKYLQEKFPFIDKKRTGIWGWSYGGYSTGMALAKDTRGVFKCGISVAPVTDWAYYDTIYTERYMGLPTPKDNLDGYVESELNNKLENFRNKMFFLVHGTLDDNVHYQQSMMLSKVLEHHDILFRQQSYPDEEHGLAGVRPHLYHSLQDFLEECFNLK